MVTAVTVHLGTIWNPKLGPHGEPLVEVHENGAIALDDKGFILHLGPASEVRRLHPKSTVMDHGQGLILPTFVDAHLHFPQLDMIGSHGESLLGWLERYTFPREAEFADTAYAKGVAERLVNELLANGIATALIFSSSHAGATHSLFEVCERRGLRAAVGKVSMDRHAPAALVQTLDVEIQETQDLVDRWHQKTDLLHYALTPRFSPCCSEALLEALGNLRRRTPSLFVQTHHAENHAEIAWVKKLFPAAKHYADTYARYGLLDQRSVLAHSLYATTDELELMKECGVSVAHCPSSNAFLGSGFFPWEEFDERGIAVLLASDIGGGTTLSPWKIMAEAYKLQRLRGRFHVSPAKLFYSATAGAAEALGFDDTGSLRAGKSGDFQILNLRNQRSLDIRFAKAASAEDQLSALIHLGDDRLTESVYVRGRKIYDQHQPQ